MCGLFTRRSEYKSIRKRISWKYISFHLTKHAVVYLIYNKLPHRHVRTQSSFRAELDVYSIEVKCNFAHKRAILARVSLWMAPLYVSMSCYISNTIPVLVVLINIRKWQCDSGLLIITTTHVIFFFKKHINVCGCSSQCSSQSGIQAVNIFPQYSSNYHAICSYHSAFYLIASKNTRTCVINGNMSKFQTLALNPGCKLRAYLKTHHHIIVIILVTCRNFVPFHWRLLFHVPVKHVFLLYRFIMQDQWDTRSWISPLWRVETIGWVKANNQFIRFSIMPIIWYFLLLIQYRDY